MSLNFIVPMPIYHHKIQIPLENSDTNPITFAIFLDFNSNSLCFHCNLSDYLLYNHFYITNCEKFKALRFVLPQKIKN